MLFHTHFIFVVESSWVELKRVVCCYTLLVVTHQSDDILLICVCTHILRLVMRCDAYYCSCCHYRCRCLLCYMLFFIYLCSSSLIFLFSYFFLYYPAEEVRRPSVIRIMGTDSIIWIKLFDSFSSIRFQLFEKKSNNWIQITDSIICNWIQWSLNSNKK